ncbi:UDP-N-acetylmuramoyl-L-alanine--D-glutamate ligase [Saprospiraceae bacterium]|nr:UDP-N-acetylmuramoyl-L-alanine--D-glutamate ligase [Saprospiraceae bacterium]
MRKLVVLGGGESGVGAALLGKKEGFDVFVSDGSKIADQYKAELLKNNIQFEEEIHTVEKIEIADVLVKSPGIPDHIALIKDLIARGLDPISEIEFAFRFCHSKIIAITGSNGKTTTTGLIHHLVEGSGMTVKVGGNYGISFARLMIEDDVPEVFVLEISSFQLDGMRVFRPDVAIMLNITPDHLDRYDYDLEKYALSKMSITRNQLHGDLFILNADEIDRMDDLSELENGEPEIALVSMEMTEEGIFDLDLENEYEYENESLAGKHNLFNTQCAVFAAEWMGVEIDHIEKKLKSFKNLPHRMEKLEKVNGVSFINDSKATNVDAVQFALDAMEDGVIWIAGGTDKGNDYASIKELVSDKVKSLICLGVDNKALIESFSGVVSEILETKDINEAVQEAFRLAEGNGTVILSPACASFDLFKNYIDRGDQFKAAVQALRLENK